MLLILGAKRLHGSVIFGYDDEESFSHSCSPFSVFWVGNIRCLGITNDTIITTRWDKVGETGDFTSAGWASDDILALTRVQAIRMGLVIDEYVDERFDPFKGKRAALQLYDEQAPVGVEEVFQYSGGHFAA